MTSTFISSWFCCKLSHPSELLPEPSSSLRDEQWEIIVPYPRQEIIDIEPQNVFWRLTDPISRAKNHGSKSEVVVERWQSIDVVVAVMVMLCIDIPAHRIGNILYRMDCGRSLILRVASWWVRVCLTGLSTHSLLMITPRARIGLVWLIRRERLVGWRKDGIALD